MVWADIKCLYLSLNARKTHTLKAEAAPVSKVEMLKLVQELPDHAPHPLPSSSWRGPGIILISRWISNQVGRLSPTIPRLDLDLRAERIFFLSLCIVFFLSWTLGEDLSAPMGDSSPCFFPPLPLMRCSDPLPDWFGCIVKAEVPCGDVPARLSENMVWRGFKGPCRSFWAHNEISSADLCHLSHFYWALGIFLTLCYVLGSFIMVPAFLVFTLEHGKIEVLGTFLCAALAPTTTLSSPCLDSGIWSNQLPPTGQQLWLGVCF